MAWRRIRVTIRGNRKTIDVDDLVEKVTSEGDYVVAIFPGGGKQYLIGDDFKLYWTAKKPKNIKNWIKPFYESSYKTPKKMKLLDRSITPWFCIGTKSTWEIFRNE